MNTEYITILDFTTACVTMIHLTEEEQKESEKYDDMYDFLSTLEEKYGFSVSNSQFMFTNSLDIECYENGEEVSTKDFFK